MSVCDAVDRLAGALGEANAQFFAITVQGGESLEDCIRIIDILRAAHFDTVASQNDVGWEIVGTSECYN